MKEFKIRCSAIGQIMTDGRAKGTMGKTAESYLKLWVLEQVFNRKKMISTKYMVKGNIMEDYGIDRIGAWLEIPDAIKNEQHFEDEFMTGTPDLLSGDMVIDLKSSWDFTTFPYFDTECPNSDYYWQLQGYMHLTGKKSAKLIYVLSDTPLHLIESECKSYCWKTGEMFEDVIADFVHRMTYNDIMPHEKIRIFDIERNDEDIQRIIERVKLCREFINNLKR